MAGSGAAMKNMFYYAAPEQAIITILLHFT